MTVRGMWTLVGAILLLISVADADPCKTPTCFKFDDDGFKLDRQGGQGCKAKTKLVVANTTGTSVRGVLSAIHSVSASKSRDSTVLHIPFKLAQNHLVGFVARASGVKTLGHETGTLQCLNGSVSILDASPSDPSLASFIEKSLLSCGRPKHSEPSSASLVLNPAGFESTHPLQASALERFLMRQGMAYEHVTQPADLCEQVHLLQRPWKAVFTVDGPHLLTLAALPRSTPAFVLVKSQEAALSSGYCALAASLGARWFLIAHNSDSVVDCKKDAAAPQPLAFVENAARCLNAHSDLCREHYGLTLGGFTEATLATMSAAVPALFATPVKIGPINWASWCYTDVWPKLLSKFLAMSFNNFYEFKKKHFPPAPPPPWTQLFSPAEDCGVAKPNFAPGFAERRLVETPWDLEVWKKYGDANKPQPRLLIVQYNTAQNTQSCRALRTAFHLGYKVNVVGYWRSKAFDYMTMSPHFMEDKIWHAMMLARDLTRHNRSDDILLVYDGTDALFQLPPSALAERFLKQKAGLFMGVEAKCSPKKPPQQCIDYTEKYFPKELRESGLPFGYINGGMYIGYAGVISRIFYSCYHVKVEATHRKEKVPYYIFKNSDQKFLYYMYMGCPLDPQLKEQIKLDHFQDAFGNTPDHWDSYEWDPAGALWYLKKDALGTSPRAVSKAQGSFADRSPVLLHFPGTAKHNYLGWNRMSTTLLQGYDGVEGPNDAFKCSTLNMVEFRDVFVGEVCPLP